MIVRGHDGRTHVFLGLEGLGVYWLGRRVTQGGRRMVSA
jgi:hypothetical protein